MGNTEQIGSTNSNRGHNGRPSKGLQFVKKLKRRLERRKAKQNPEAPCTYGKYSGYN